MARKFLKRMLPAPEKMREHPSLRVFGSRLHDPNLWHLNRRSVTVAVFIGLFIAFIPVPSQMLLAGLVAISFRANLPLSVVLVWITNPITIPPIFYFTYKIGALMLGIDANPIQFELSWHWLEDELMLLWKPLLLGSVVTGLFFGLLGSAIIHTLWRIHVIHRWRKRRKLRSQQRR